MQHVTAPVLLLLIFPTTVWAAEPLSMGSAALQMTWALLIVIGLILALYGLTRKRLLLGKMGSNAIKIIETRALMPKSTLALVEVRGKEYLLGIGTDGIRLLVDLSKDDTRSKKASFESLLTEEQ